MANTLDGFLAVATAFGVVNFINGILLMGHHSILGGVALLVGLLAFSLGGYAVKNNTAVQIKDVQDKTITAGFAFGIINIILYVAVIVAMFKTLHDE